MVAMHVPAAIAYAQWFAHQLHKHQESLCVLTRHNNTSKRCTTWSSWLSSPCYCPASPMVRRRTQDTCNAVIQHSLWYNTHVALISRHLGFQHFVAHGRCATVEDLFFARAQASPQQCIVESEPREASCQRLCSPQIALPCHQCKCCTNVYSRCSVFVTTESQTVRTIFEVLTFKITKNLGTCLLPNTVVKGQQMCFFNF